MDNELVRMISPETEPKPSMAFDNTALETAMRLAETLCRTAKWNADETLCHWQGSTVLDADSEFPRSVTRDLDGDLYNGTAGIALFLSDVARHHPDARLMQTTRGAIRFSFRWASPDAFPLGVYAGRPGLLYLAQHLDDAFKTLVPDGFEDELFARIEAVLSNRKPILLDLFNGAAGAVLVLLRAGARGLELATRLGEEICARADWSDDHCSWDSQEACGLQAEPLSGLSHGASGIALALLRLFAATGEQDFLVTARGAYAYEDTLFEPALDNWLDVRFVETVEEARRKQRAAPAWCHGAPGIALSRMEACRLDGECAGQYAPMLDSAIVSTQRMLQTALDDDGYDASLCHGVAGLCGILDLLGRGLERLELREVARASMTRLIGQHADLVFPSGIFDRSPSPSLMLGTAGIGYGLLRLRENGERDSLLLL